MTKKRIANPAYAIPLTEADLAKIGKFIVIWNQVEMLMDLIAITALGIPLEVGEKIMSSPSVVARSQIFIEVIRALIDDPAIVTTARQCAGQIQEISNFRNDVAHGRWAFSVDSQSARGKKQLLQGREVTVDLVDERTTIICNLSKKLADLMIRVLHFKQPDAFALPSPWHGQF